MDIDLVMVQHVNLNIAICWYFSLTENVHHVALSVHVCKQDDIHALILIAHRCIHHLLKD